MLRVWGAWASSALTPGGCVGAEIRLGDKAVSFTTPFSPSMTSELSFTPSLHLPQLQGDVRQARTTKFKSPRACDMMPNESKPL